MAIPYRLAMNLDWIRKGLKKPGKTQRGLAKALGKDESAVSRILAGQRQIKASEIPKIAAYLKETPPVNGTESQVSGTSSAAPTAKEVEEARHVESIILAETGASADAASFALALKIVLDRRSGR